MLNFSNNPHVGRSKFIANTVPKLCDHPDLFSLILAACKARAAGADAQKLNISNGSNPRA